MAPGMERRVAALIAAAAAATATASTHHVHVHGDLSMCRGAAAAGWTLTFEDHFDGNELNSTNWKALDSEGGPHKSKLRP